VGYSSISVWRQLPFFGTTYVASKVMASHTGLAVGQELQTNQYGEFVDHMTVYPGGVLTSIFNRPESARFAKIMPLQACAMQSAEKAVNSYIKALENGYKMTYGTVFCELFNVGWFKVMGSFTPVFNTLMHLLSSYFGATYGAPAAESELGLDDPLYKHIWCCFVRPFLT
jgi:hypothetical protein